MSNDAPLSPPTPMPDALSTLMRCQSDASVFVTDLLGVKPEPWQRDALRIVSRQDRLAIRSGHGVGKTSLLSWLVLWFILTRFPCKIAVVANSENQLKDTIWPEISVWAQRLPAELREQLILEKERIYLKAAPDSSFATARTASKDNPDALQGLHSEHMLFLLDEASGLAEAVFERALGALSTPGAKVVMAGNPTRLSGFFYEAFHGNRSRWACMKVSCEDVPRARHHIEDIIQTYGVESNAYRVRVLGEFPATEDEQIVPLELLEAAVKREVEPSETFRVVWGLDVARYGDDRSALAKRRGNVLLEEIRWWRKKDTMQTAGLVMEAYKKTPPEDRPSEILVDVIGVGAGVVDRLGEMGLPVRGVNVSERAAADERFSRLRDELWWRAREWFESLDCKIPNDKTLIEELSTPRYTFTSHGKILVERKEEMKKRGMPSPDIAEAFILTLAGGLDLVQREERPKRYTRSGAAGQNEVTWMGI